MVQAKLAACVNIMPAGQSTYIWEGKLCNESEHLAVIKTMEHRYQELEQYIKQHHPYELPEIISTLINNGSKEYLAWLTANTNIVNFLRIAILLFFAFVSTSVWADSPLATLGGEEEEEFLDPDVAFVVTAKQGGDNSIKNKLANTRWLLSLTKNKISVAPADESQITLGNLPLPEGEEKEDEYFGLIVSIDHEFNAEIPITKLAANTQAVDLIFKYQGCAKAGFCYPPITKTIKVNLDSTTTATHSRCNG